MSEDLSFTSAAYAAFVSSLDFCETSSVRLKSHFLTSLIRSIDLEISILSISAERVIQRVSRVTFIFVDESCLALLAVLRELLVIVSNEISTLFETMKKKFRVSKFLFLKRTGMMSNLNTFMLLPPRCHSMLRSRMIKRILIFSINFSFF